MDGKLIFPKLHSAKNYFFSQYFDIYMFFNVRLSVCFDKLLFMDVVILVQIVLFIADTFNTDRLSTLFGHV